MFPGAYPIIVGVTGEVAVAEVAEEEEEKEDEDEE